MVASESTSLFYYRHFYETFDISKTLTIKTNSYIYSFGSRFPCFTGRVPVRQPLVVAPPVLGPRT